MVALPLPTQLVLPGAASGRAKQRPPKACEQRASSVVSAVGGVGGGHTPLSCTEVAHRVQRSQTGRYKYQQTQRKRPVSFQQHLSLPPHTQGAPRAPFYTDIPQCGYQPLTRTHAQPPSPLCTCCAGDSPRFTVAIPRDEASGFVNNKKETYVDRSIHRPMFPRSNDFLHDHGRPATSSPGGSHSPAICLGRAGGRQGPEP